MNLHVPPPWHYDAHRRRLWLFGQRCHHGAAGALLASAAAGVLAGSRARRARGASALAGIGGALMLHDVKDLALWFERGAGSQL